MLIYFNVLPQVAVEPSSNHVHECDHALGLFVRQFSKSAFSLRSCHFRLVSQS